MTEDQEWHFKQQNRNVKMYSALFHLKEDKLTQIASEDFADTSY